jgi:hypothetical protein
MQAGKIVQDIDYSMKKKIGFTKTIRILKDGQNCQLIFRPKKAEIPE